MKRNKILLALIKALGSAALISLVIWLVTLIGIKLDVLAVFVGSFVASVLYEIRNC